MTGALSVALIQLTVGDDPMANLRDTVPLIRQAAAQGAQFILTPEATNILSPDRDWQARVLHPESSDPTLSALRAEAQAARIWLLIGSLALKTDDPDGRFANRSFLIDPNGQIAARYDKLHMFDVQISDTEQFRESAAYRPGDRAVVANMDGVGVGMTVCYDLRFPHLYRHLAQAGAQILTVPSAFNPTTGAAHWETLLRARAIETGCFVLAPAQAGTHPAPHARGRAPRHSYGHSLVVDPWGRVLSDAGESEKVTIVSLDLQDVKRTRLRIPSLNHDRDFLPADNPVRSDDTARHQP
ncbi:carbon-nitrogen hydrolase family protein [Paracoccus sp. (in: a-proteobacteria)]|uniref:carbon-nitrogen hydrolase family protein n=1 Tax=Paracoccus sp. TaxID=267 RepID=UPI0026DFD61D|nr:carbon-nitrogen hydrolase family protein [Paracoccus sp. (in: a-proteobacteria)]MDO5648741.1 carbon-nitrogen hydrolase family protein [Paracoccus sp. (in: a-proteobacteria)]